MKAFVQVFSFDLVSKVMLGILGILLIRYMPQGEYGAYTLAVALVTFFSQGLSASFNRIYIVAYQQLRMRGSELAFVSLQMMLIAGLVLLGMPLAVSLGGLYWVVAALILVNCLSEFTKTSFQQDLKFLSFSLVEFLRSLVFLCCTALLIAAQRGELTAELVLLIQVASLVCVSWWAIHKRFTRLNGPRWADIRRLSTEILRGEHRYLFAYFFLLGIFTQTDVFMLGLLGDTGMLATYGSAFRYYSILSLALGSVHVVLLPMIQQASNDKELFAIFERHRRIIVWFMAVVLLVAWAAQWMIPLLDSGKYPGAVLAFRILCISAIISFGFSPHVNLVMRFSRFKFLFLLIGFALVLNIGINLALIPLYGAAGAAVATLISSAAVTVPIYFQSSRLVAEHFSKH